MIGAYRSLSYADVSRLIKYSPDTGALEWRRRDLSLFKSVRQYKTWNARFAGLPAMTSVNAQGYLCGKIIGLPCKAHHIAWMMLHKDWPDGEVDHIDRDKRNNSAGNLRLVDRSRNCMNRRSHVGSTSKFKGVSFKEANGKWVAQVQAGGKGKHIGYFDNELDAALAYDIEVAKMHGEYGVNNGTI